MKKVDAEWNVYRTRFLVKAKQLTQPCSFVDFLGHEHHGREGDYLVEFTDGTQRIAPRKFFEDIYVVMGSCESSETKWSPPEKREVQVESPSRRLLSRRALVV